jgi:hypothetical protein
MASVRNPSSDSVAIVAAARRIGPTPPHLEPPIRTGPTV